MLPEEEYAFAAKARSGRQEGCYDISGSCGYNTDGAAGRCQYGTVLCERLCECIYNI